MMKAIKACCKIVKKAIQGYIQHLVRYMSIAWQLGILFKNFFFSIIESVDSICRDRADTQYMLIQNNLLKSQKRAAYAFMMTYYSSSSVFLAKKTPSVVKNRQNRFSSSSLHLCACVESNFEL